MQVVPGFGLQGVDVVDGEPAGELDRLPQLQQVPRAVRARVEVTLEALTIGNRERAVEIARDDLDELDAHELGRPAAEPSQHHRTGSSKWLFERGPHLRPCPVQQHPLVGLRQIERVTHLVGPPSFEIAQGDHHLLPRRQRGDRPPHDVQGLAGRQPRLRLLVPGHRWRRPGPGARSSRRPEAIRDRPRPPVRRLPTRATRTAPTDAHGCPSCARC